MSDRLWDEQLRMARELAALKRQLAEREAAKREFELFTAHTTDARSRLEQDLQRALASRREIENVLAGTGVAALRAEYEASLRRAATFAQDIERSQRAMRDLASAVQVTRLYDRYVQRATIQQDYLAFQASLSGPYTLAAALEVASQSALDPVEPTDSAAIQQTFDTTLTFVQDLLARYPRSVLVARFAGFLVANVLLPIFFVAETMLSEAETKRWRARYEERLAGMEASIERLHSEEEAGTLYAVTRNAPVRSAPQARASRLGTIAEGAMLEVVRIEGRWAFAKYLGPEASLHEGWVFLGNLRPVEL